MSPAPLAVPLLPCESPQSRRYACRIGGPRSDDCHTATQPHSHHSHTATATTATTATHHRCKRRRRTPCCSTRNKLPSVCRFAVRKRPSCTSFAKHRTSVPCCMRWTTRLTMVASRLDSATAPFQASNRRWNRHTRQRWVNSCSHTDTRRHTQTGESQEVSEYRHTVSHWTHIHTPLALQLDNLHQALHA